MDFTYEIPNEETYLSVVIMRLRDKINVELLNFLSKSKCTINPTSTYSNSRWNAYYTTVDFAVNQRDYDKIIALMNHSETKLIVQWACNEVMPAKAGFDILEVTVSISLEDIPQPQSTMQDLKNIIEELPSKVKDAVIPKDILEKAKEMSEVYLYTYCAENALRAFIAAVEKSTHPLVINRDMENKIKERKKLQEKKQWLSIRGSSDIFYLDIDDLGKLIANNWDVFKVYFDRVDWVTVNISEIADCRNQVAHHSYLEEHERQIIRTDFIKILKQISDKFK